MQPTLIFYKLIGYHSMVYLIRHSALVDQFSVVVHEPSQELFKWSVSLKS